MWASVSPLRDEGPNELWVQQRLLKRPVHMEVMDMGGPWVGLGGRPLWALGNWQLRWVGRQRSCEEVLMQEGLQVVNKKAQSLPPPQPQTNTCT
jgi:hypothetical protein